MKLNEFIKEFDKRYPSTYDYEWEEEFGELTLWFSDFLESKITYIKVSFPDDGCKEYSIYAEFIYEDCYSPFIALTVTKTKMQFFECLNDVLGYEPETAYEDGMGCPFNCDLVGLFSRPFSWESIDEHLKLIDLARQRMCSASLDTTKKASKLYSAYKEEELELFVQLKNLCPALCCTHIKDSPLNKDHHADDYSAYIDRRGIIMTGIGIDSLTQLAGNPCDEQYHIYSGVRYHVIQATNADRMAVTDQRLIEEVLDFFSQTHEEWDVDGCVKYFLDKHIRLAMTCGELWAIICQIKAERQEDCLVYEKNQIKKLQRDYISIAPQKLWERPPYDFSMLSDRQFESLSRDLLLGMGFKNVQARGDTHTSDGGVDIIAEEEFETAIGLEKRTWIFQCKQQKRQVTRQVLSEVRDLLRSFHADAYGLFHSGYFSLQVLDRIKCLNENESFIVKGWDASNLEVLLERFPKISTKYFGL